MEPAMRYASFPLMRLDKAVGIGREHALELLFGVLVQIAGGADGLHDGGTGGIVVQILDVYKRQAPEHCRSDPVTQDEFPPEMKFMN